MMTTRKTILITGATDGIGLRTARLLAPLGHDLLLHGRSPDKLEKTKEALSALEGAGRIGTHAADLSRLDEVEALAAAIAQDHPRLDVLINNAGVYTTEQRRNADGLDVRFVVNTIAPYLLTRRLLPLMRSSGRVINLSSAAQASVDEAALLGDRRLEDSAAYAQSKLALTMWSRHLALELGDDGPAIIAVNPGSFLGTKMVRQAYGQRGADVGIGAEILCRAALDDEFASASGRYFDNDSGRFAAPHPDARDPRRIAELVRALDQILQQR